MATTGTSQSLYTKMCGDRDPYLERARDSSRLTLPTLVPEEGATSSTQFHTPFQSVGARGVNNLASALLLSLLPPNAPFFRLVLDAKAKAELEQVDPQIKNEIDRSMAEIERSIMREIEVNNVRTTFFEAIKHLIVAGNVLLYLPDEGNMRAYHMDRYVVSRDPMGTVRKIIVKECVSPDSLPKEIRSMVSESMSGTEKTVDIYTCAKTRPDGKTEVYQETQGVPIPGTQSVYPEGKSPFIALRMIQVDGEDYGRGYVEQYIGDLKSLEGLSRAIVEGSAASAKVLFLVNPNGTTRARTLAQSPNGAIREGNAGDVSVLQVAKQGDFSVALQTMQQIQERLSYAFLLTESTIRNADRVTAEEVRLVTQSIERQLGGVYSLLSQEAQLPMVHRMMDRMQTNDQLPDIPDDLVTPTIVTGIDALGRGNDLNRLDVYLQGIAQTMGAEMLGQYVNFREYLDRRASALGIDTDGLIKSEEEIAQEQQQAMQMQMMQQMGPQALDAINQNVMQTRGEQFAASAAQQQQGE